MESAAKKFFECVIIGDFINSLIIENFLTYEYITDIDRVECKINKYGFDANSFLANNKKHGNKFILLENVKENEILIFPVVKGILSTWKYNIGDDILLIKNRSRIYAVTALILFDFMRRINVFGECSSSIIDDVRNQFKVCVEQANLLTCHKIDIHNFLFRDKASAKIFHDLECYAGYRDRPYHPLAKLKDGFNLEEYIKYSPEFQQEICVRWVAVQKEKIMYGSGVGNIEIHNPSQLFLTQDDKRKLDHELIQKGLYETHLAMPVHPWQFEHILDKFYHQDMLNNICSPLTFVSYDMYASSSTRSLLSIKIPQYCLKLPLGIKALGALRFLPIVKMINGEKNQNLLQKAKQIDIKLAQKLWLCEETKWWSYLPEKQDDKTPDNEWLFVEKPTHLAAQCRYIPYELLQEPYQLIPMASLGYVINGQPSIFDYILELQCSDKTQNSVKKQFSNLCWCFFEVIFRLFKLGIVGEIHGQNICIVLKNGCFDGLLFRDHDSVRIYLPWIIDNGLTDPDYLSPHNFRNTLYNTSMEGILFYIQTLGIQVNIASIIETLSSYYRIIETDLWLILIQQLERAIEAVDFSSEIKNKLRKYLLEAHSYPYKQLLNPLFTQDTRIGTMPFGIGETQNPLKYVLDKTTAE